MFLYKLILIKYDHLFINKHGTIETSTLNTNKYVQSSTTKICTIVKKIFQTEVFSIHCNAAPLLTEGDMLLFQTHDLINRDVQDSVCLYSKLVCTISMYSIIHFIQQGHFLI